MRHAWYVGDTPNRFVKLLQGHVAVRESQPNKGVGRGDSLGGSSTASVKPSSFVGKIGVGKKGGTGTWGVVAADVHPLDRQRLQGSLRLAPASGSCQRARQRRNKYRYNVMVGVGMHDHEAKVEVQAVCCHPAPGNEDPWARADSKEQLSQHTEGKKR